MKLKNQPQTNFHELLYEFTEKKNKSIDKSTLIIIIACSIAAVVTFVINKSKTRKNSNKKKEDHYSLLLLSIVAVLNATIEFWKEEDHEMGMKIWII